MTCKLNPTLILICFIPTHEASCNLLLHTYRERERERIEEQEEAGERERERVGILSFMKEQASTRMNPQIFEEPDHQVALDVSVPSEVKITDHHDDQSFDQKVTPPPSDQSPKTHQLVNNLIVSKEFDDEEKEAAIQGPSSKKKNPVEASTTSAPIDSALVEDTDTDTDTGRERLKRHRTEMAGRTWIPDIWGQEELLKDWIDCTKFDASLVTNNIMSARAALVQEGRRANSSGLRIENRC